ncbi:MAG TPA: 3-keto-5-aminohexanoate cleavage protein [Gemmatimonadaceae bacterium]|nr:3-keto-5-aminohexanoate cleavage protein [Gemmatimonadaceae bacterium]
MNKLIINLAPTGMVPTTTDNSSVPVDVEAISSDAAACRSAGASMIHVHARDENQAPTWRSEVYREIVLAVREKSPDLIVVVSTSGRTHGAFEQRSDVLNLDGKAKPDMASLTLGSLNFPKQASVNEPSMIRRLADTMRERGIVPELEVFDFGMLDYAKYLIERGVLREPFYFNLLLGSLGTLSATPFNLASLVMQLPQGATWAAAGIGRFQFAMNSLAVVTGGHVRIGLEDNLFMDSGKSRPASNCELVKRIARLAHAAERPIATPLEARAIIGLPERTQ